MKLPQHVTIEEQGLRDGLQSINTLIPTQQKLDLIQRLVAAGVQRLQVASFVHPEKVPQMADADELCRNLPDLPSVLFSALVLNSRGVERAADTALSHLSISLSASDTHSRKNAGKTLAEARSAFKEMLALAKSKEIRVRAGIQCAFGCRFEGKISTQLVLDLAREHLDAGADELALADSTGMAQPAQLFELMSQLKAISGEIPVGLHLHNTENKGLANVYAALQAQVDLFDTAFGGLGGCPFIKSATGNIATEDTVHMLDQMEISTGIDKRKVAEISLDLEKQVKQKFPGMMKELLSKEIIVV